MALRLGLRDNSESRGSFTEDAARRSGQRKVAEKCFPAIPEPHEVVGKASGHQSLKPKSMGDWKSSAKRAQGARVAHQIMGTCITVFVQYMDGLENLHEQQSIFVR